MTTTTTAQAARGDTTPAAVLVCDPPWRHRDALGDRGAAANYETMATDDIAMLELPPTAERHVLFLWRLSSMPQDALTVCLAWHFEPVAEVVWQKLRPCQTCCATGRVDAYQLHGEQAIVPGTDNRCPTCRGVGGEQLLDEDLGARVPSSFGLGTTVRNCHETAIIARPIGGRAPERLNADVRSYFAAPMLIDVDALLPESNGRRGALVHSAKPDAFYRLVERMYDGPRVEMFSRRRRDGWVQAHSNENDKMDRVAKIMRDVWPAREREKRLADARRRVERR
jgi:N6-adenosine-specific RNA methylase IME4